MIFYLQKPNGEATNGTAERRRVLRSLAREPKLSIILLKKALKLIFNVLKFQYR
jgi:hypothetical protein